MKFDYKKIMGQIMHTKGLVVIGLIGIALMLLPNLSAKKPAEEVKIKQEEAGPIGSQYELRLEKQLADILSTLRGVSNVSVMITLEDDGESYYAKNESADSKRVTDGSLQESNSQSEGSLALKNDAGGGQSAVALKKTMPRVSGVLVTAKGVADAKMQTDVMNAVRAVLNVPAHRVQVLEKG